MKMRAPFLGLAAALVGCPSPEGQPAPSPSPAPAAPGEAGTPSTAPAGTPATGAASPTPSEAPPAEPSPETPTPAPELAPETTERLHVIARAGTTTAVHPLVDGSLLVSAGPLVLRVDEQGELSHDPKMLSGIKSVRGAEGVSPEDDEFAGVSAWWPVAIGGRWPGAVYMSLDIASGFRGEGGVPDVHRWDGQRWVHLEARRSRYRWYPAEVHPWIDGSLLARRVFIPQPAKGEFWDADTGPTERELAVAKAAIDKAKPIVVIRGAPKAPAVPSKVTAFTSLSTGEVFVVDAGNPPSLVRLDAGGARHTVPLPGEGASARGVRADGPERAWVFGAQEVSEAQRPWLVRIDKDVATAVEGPGCADHGLASFVALDGGEQWATCGFAVDDPVPFEMEGFELWRRPAGGTWARFPLPEGVKMPRRVVARSGADVWVSARDAKGGVVLHSRPRSKVLRLPGLPALGRQVIEWGEPLPVSDCSFPYVPLRSSPKEAKTVEAALAEPIEALGIETSIVLVRTTIRDRPQLGLQLFIPQEEDDAKRVASAARKALGDEAVDEPRCWFAKEADDTPIASWGEPF